MAKMFALKKKIKTNTKPSGSKMKPKSSMKTSSLNVKGGAANQAKTFMCSGGMIS